MTMKIYFTILPICLLEMLMSTTAYAEENDLSAVFTIDYFLLISEKQIRGILTEYVNYYNTQRPHQGIVQNIPQRYKPQLEDEVKKIPILGGLCYHYERRVA